MKSLILMSAWIAVCPVNAADDSAWQHGRDLYRQGWDGQASCMRCHGRQGEGRVEGGLRAPALNGKTNLGELENALIKGVNGAGLKLHPLMPRYHLDAARLEDLRAYLAVIDRDTPGVSESAVRIGAALPPTVYGAAVQAGLNEAFDQVVVYGRRVELAVNSPPEELFASAASMSARSYADGANPDEGVPNIGPLPVPGSVAVSEDSSAAAQFNFFLIPSALEQARMLLSAAMREHRQGTVNDLLLINENGDDPLLSAIVAALREQARAEQRHLRVQIGTGRAPMPGEVVIFLGGSATLQALLDAAGSAPVYANAVQVWPAALRLSREQAARLRLFLPWRTRHASFDLASAYRDAAYASGQVLVEALKRCGRQLGQTELLEQLQNLRNFPIQSYGTIDFRSDQHYGGHGGELLAFDAERGIFSVLRETP
ncbi:MAG TPA: hypothetical protein VIF60_07070 [Burkholderiaceae bacterium]